MNEAHRIAYIYSLLIFFKSSIHYIHLVYYVQIFVSVYKIDSISFGIVQCIFLLWNTLNDPLFGWLNDRYVLSLIHRLRYLRISTTFFFFSSLLFWFPWTIGDISLLPLQLLISLCLYDTFLTVLDLNYNALLIDFPDSERERLSSASAVGHAFGSINRKLRCS